MGGNKGGFIVCGVVVISGGCCCCVNYVKVMLLGIAIVLDDKLVDCYFKGSLFNYFYWL